MPAVLSFACFEPVRMYDFIYEWKEKRELVIIQFVKRVQTDVVQGDVVREAKCF